MLALYRGSTLLVGPAAGITIARNRSNTLLVLVGRGVGVIWLEPSISGAIGESEVSAPLFFK